MGWEGIGVEGQLTECCMIGVGARRLPGVSAQRHSTHVCPEPPAEDEGRSPGLRTGPVAAAGGLEVCR